MSNLKIYSLKKYFQNIFINRLLLLLAFILLFRTNGTSQIISGVVNDKINGKAVSFAAVQVFTGGELKLYVANSEGKFSFNRNIPFDSIIISSLGYETRVFYENERVYELLPLIYSLKEVTIRPLKKKYIGLKDDLFGGVNNVSATGLARISYIPNNVGKKVVISQVIINCPASVKQDTNCYDLIKILLFERTPNHKPGKDLCQIPIYAYKYQFKDKIIIDILKYNIYLPKEGLFVGYVFIGSYNKLAPSDTKLCAYRSALKYRYLNSTTLVSFIKNFDKPKEEWQLVSSSNGKNRYFLFGITIMK